MPTSVSQLSGLPNVFFTFTNSVQQKVQLGEEEQVSNTSMSVTWLLFATFCSSCEYVSTYVSLFLPSKQYVCCSCFGPTHIGYVTQLLSSTWSLYSRVDLGAEQLSIESYSSDYHQYRWNFYCSEFQDRFCFPALL